MQPRHPVRTRRRSGELTHRDRTEVTAFHLGLPLNGLYIGAGAFASDSRMHEFDRRFLSTEEVALMLEELDIDPEIFEARVQRDLIGRAVGTMGRGQAMDLPIIRVSISELRSQHDPRLQSALPLLSAAARKNGDDELLVLPKVLAAVASICRLDEFECWRMLGRAILPQSSTGFGSDRLAG